MRMSLLIIALVLAAILALTHFVALDGYLYWYYPLLDVPMHLLAGLVMGAAVGGVLGRQRPIAFFAAVVAGALGWEIFEYIARISTGQPDYWYDTTIDVVNGVFGAGLVYLVAHFTLWRSR